MKVYEAWKKSGIACSLSERGILTNFYGSSVTIPWLSVERVAPTKDTYTLVLESYSFICIPKRNVPRERLEDFTSLLNAKVGNAAKVLERKRTG